MDESNKDTVHMSQEFFWVKMAVILGKKIGMTNYFNAKGDIVPLTLVEAGPCVVTQIKNIEKDGYETVQIGYGESKKIAKPQLGHFKTIKDKPKYLREVEIEAKDLKLGDQITCAVFKEGEIVDVIGTSKGKGFAGTIKRHNFKRGPKTHGSHSYRTPGSIGSMFPQHVFKGTKLPGRMGHARVTVQNLKIEKVDQENNILAIEGAIPGPKKSLVLIQTVKNSKVKAENK